MLNNSSDVIKEFFLPSVLEEYKTEFESDVSKINIPRGKITAITFIIMESLIFSVSLLTKKETFFKPPDKYYGTMYLIMIVAMVAHLLMFIKFGKDVEKYKKGIWLVGISFAVFILLWCAGISLLDLSSHGGQAIVYIVAIISIAVTPLYEPITLLAMYLSVHVLFLFLMPYFQSSDGMLFSNYINSTAFLIIAWVVAQMRYKGQIVSFINKKEIQKKNEELNKVNRELEEANQKLETLSHTDGLTGISNRLAFDKSISMEWYSCKRQFKPISLIMIDIDFYKEYNDNYGHQSGDECIRQVASALSICAKRSSDIVARYGGDEFAIILPQTDKENADKIAIQMKARVDELEIIHEYSSASKYVTISMGVNTVIPSDELSINDFITNADRALYEAKKNNRNNIVSA